MVLVSAFPVERVVEEMTVLCLKDEETPVSGFWCSQKEAWTSKSHLLVVPQSPKQTERYFISGCTVGACAGQDVSRVHGEQLSVCSDPPLEQTEDASVLLPFIYHSCCPWRGP